MNNIAATSKNIQRYCTPKQSNKIYVFLVVAMSNKTFQNFQTDFVSMLTVSVF